MLYNRTKQTLLLRKLRVAESFKDRFFGLLPYAGLTSEEGLLIRDCSSIHTIFMRFAIDCFFLDDHLRVLKVRKNVVPHKVAFGKLPGTRHVLEVAAVRDVPMNLEVNDILEIKERETT